MNENKNIDPVVGIQIVVSEDTLARWAKEKEKLNAVKSQDTLSKLSEENNRLKTENQHLTWDVEKNAALLENVCKGHYGEMKAMVITVILASATTAFLAAEFCIHRLVLSVFK